MKTELPKIKTKKKKRKGRGYGSGKGGHTVGRGQKGQKARSKIGILFEGVKMKKSFIKRLPLRRGKGKFKARPKPIIVKLEYLNLLPAGSRVNIETLVKHRIVDVKQAKSFGVKILGDGEMKKKMVIELPISKSAAKRIEKVGGKVISLSSKSETRRTSREVTRRK
jgi:large subunit ribosomal protein L15